MKTIRKIICEKCGEKHFIKKAKRRQDTYVCIYCKHSFAVRDADKYKYVMRNNEVYKHE